MGKNEKRGEYQRAGEDGNEQYWSLASSFLSGRHLHILSGCVIQEVEKLPCLVSKCLRSGHYFRSHTTIGSWMRKTAHIDFYLD